MRKLWLAFVLVAANLAAQTHTPHAPPISWVGVTGGEYQRVDWSKVVSVRLDPNFVILEQVQGNRITDYLSAGDAGEAIRRHIVSSPGWVSVKMKQTDMTAPRYAALDLIDKVALIQAHEDVIVTRAMLYTSSGFDVGHVYGNGIAALEHTLHMANNSTRPYAAKPRHGP